METERIILVLYLVLGVITIKESDGATVTPTPDTHSTATPSNPGPASTDTPRTPSPAGGTVSTTTALTPPSTHSSATTTGEFDFISTTAEPTDEDQHDTPDTQTVLIALVAVLLLLVIGLGVAVSCLGYYLRMMYKRMNTMSNTITILRMTFDLPSAHDPRLTPRPPSEVGDVPGGIPRIPSKKRKGSAPQLSIPHKGTGFDPPPPSHSSIRRPSLPVTPSQYRTPNSPITPTSPSPLTAIREEASFSDVKQKLQQMVKKDSGFDEDDEVEDPYQNSFMIDSYRSSGGKEGGLELKDIPVEENVYATPSDMVT